MENDEYLFDHSNYGEGFDGMAAHVADMRPLERMLFEDAVYRGGKVMMPHENVATEPFYFGIRYISRRAGCSDQEAEVLKDAYRTLYADKKMVDTFNNWVKTKGAATGVPYFAGLAEELRRIEQLPEDDALAQADRERAELAEDAYAYHPVGEYEAVTPWLEKQPRAYQNLMTKLQHTNVQEELAAIGKRAYEMPLSKEQGTVLWDHYHIQREKISRATPISQEARLIVGRIEKTAEALSQVGKWLYEKRQTNGDGLSKHDWNVIWETYRTAKDRRTRPAAT